MRRVLSLFLPRFSVDLVRRELRRRGGGRDDGAGRAVLVVETVANRRVVVSWCERCVDVRAGMTLAHARAIVPEEPIVANRDFRAESAKLTALAVWALRWTPIAAPDPPDGLVLDISGCAHLFGDESGLARSLVAGVDRLGLSARAAIAPTAGCAWGVARFGGRRIALIGEGEQRAAMAPLPLGALHLEEETIAALDELGVQTVGQVLDLPRSALPSRFDSELLMRLDCALGSAMEVIEPVRPVEPARVERVLDGATTRAEAVAAVVRELVGELCDRLRTRGEGARRVDVVLERIDAERIVLVVSLSAPSRDAHHLWSLVRPKLERVNLGFGVEGVSVTAARVGRLGHDERRWWREPGLGAGERRAMHELIDTLAGRLGHGRIYRAHARGTHIPECVYAMTAGAQEARSGATSRIDADRPSVLMDLPEPADVIALSPDGPPARIRWRGVDRDVVTAIGPERIGREWWREGGRGERMEPPSVTGATSPPVGTGGEGVKAGWKPVPRESVEGGEGGRDYFKVQDAHGRWIWVFREWGRWCVHGMWE